MTFAELRNEHITELSGITGAAYAFHDRETCIAYGQDHTEDLLYPAGLVLKPSSTEEVSAIAAYCFKNNIPLTCRGAGTGLSGGCLPVKGGVVLSLERLNRIIHIDTVNHQAIVEPGVINEQLQQEVIRHGLFYPPDPASKGSCTLGGNVAHSSGGPRCVKYGTTKDYILNLQVVLADGSILETGANVLKNSTGYHLTQLMTGSEGTLGIVSRMTLRLIPYPPYRILLLACFPDARSACACVPEIYRTGVQPSAMEFMDRKGVELSVSHSGASFDFGSEKAYLLIEADGFSQDELMPQCEKMFPALENCGALNVLLADDSESMERLWKIRRSIGEAVKLHSVYKEEDTVVTRSYLPDLYEQVEIISAEYGFETVCYGHAGDGNLHVNILKGRLDDEIWNEKLPEAIRRIFEHCYAYGGTISGEHGIGLVQKSYLDIVFSEKHFELMRAIKLAFDPKGILNPGKIFDLNA